VQLAELWLAAQWRSLVVNGTLVPMMSPNACFQAGHNALLSRAFVQPLVQQSSQPDVMAAGSERGAWCGDFSRDQKTFAGACGSAVCSTTLNCVILIKAKNTNLSVNNPVHIEQS
jgi:hypothetical protein